MSDDVDLDARLDTLFAGDPKDFTAARDALARELRNVGRALEAADVKALRRPTVAVAAVNRAARERPELVAELVEVGGNLSALQAGTNVDREALRDHTRQRRELLHQLTEQAAGSTERPESARAAIAATLDAASLDAVLRDELRRGRLTRELTPAARFVASGDDPGDDPAPRPPGRRSAPPRDELAARRARAELDAARDRADAAATAMREHTEAADEADERLDAVHHHVADLEAELADARAELAEAKHAARDARRVALRAVTEHERVTAALRAAERTVARAAETNQPTA